MSTPTISPTSTERNSKRHSGVRARKKEVCGQTIRARATQKCPRHHEVCVHTGTEGAGFLLYTSQMHSRSVNTNALLLLAAVMVAAVSLGTAHAADLARNPELCDKLFNLPQGTITRAADAKVMSPEVCAAYQFLISRYTPGPRSSKGLSNPKVDGITGLNPDFAVALARMLNAAPYMMINSAYRTKEGQGSVNPDSNHTYGCAVDLGYAQSNCGSSQCQFVLREGPSTYGLQIRMKYDPEWNHVEPVNVQQCRAKGPGGGVTPGTASPPSELSDAIRRAMGQQPPMQPQQPLPPQPTLPPQPASPAQPAVSSESPNTSASTKPSIADLININTNDNTNTNKSTSSPTSTIDLINEFLDPISDSIDIGKIVDIDLNPDTSDATSLDARRPTSTRVSATSSNYSNLSVPQTFTTNDLSKGTVSGYIVGENTFILRMLDAMKNTLLLALNYLKPFRGYVPGTVPPGTSSAYAD